MHNRTQMAVATNAALWREVADLRRLHAQQDAATFAVFAERAREAATFDLVNRCDRA